MSTVLSLRMLKSLAYAVRDDGIEITRGFNCATCGAVVVETTSPEDGNRRALWFDCPDAPRKCDLKQGIDDYLAAVRQAKRDDVV